ncbi:MAG: DUF3307 domain-containing protein [Bacteroidia bacterium]|nr:DUF3307 domain-containing protein [Bacteroidia bacterium]
MNSQIMLFTPEHGSFLIRLVLAHVLSDFILQSNKMVQNKGWLTRSMLFHIIGVYMSTALITGWWFGSALIALLHYLIDGLKIKAQQNPFLSAMKLFIADQLLHITVLIIAWAWHFDLWQQLEVAYRLPFTDYRLSLILLGYVLVTLPVGMVIKLATKKIRKSTLEGIENEHGVQNNTNENGGRIIGIFERIIILTFVLLGQYEAIGFLITGKSIIRFADKDSHLRSEYVLVGTMMSYAICILVGVGINCLLKIFIA